MPDLSSAPRPVADGVETRSAAHRGSPAGAPSAPSGPVRTVLFVCTANICRSAFAHRLLQWLLPDLRVRSAGTVALEGHGIDETIARELDRRGIPISSEHARQVTGADLDADLILTMSATHRRVLLEERPDAVDRIGLLSAVDALAKETGGRVLDRADVARWARGSFSLAEGIADPYGRGEEANEQAAERIEQAVEILADLIAPPHLAQFLDDADAAPGPDQDGSAPPAGSPGAGR